MDSKKKPLVILTHKLPEPVEKRMSELFDMIFSENDTPMTREHLIAALQRADVLVPTISDHIDNEMLDYAGKNLKLIANFGNGTDNIDVQSATNRGIVVTNTPNVLTDDTADMTMALILAVPRRLVEGAIVLDTKGAWSGWSPNWMLGRRIGGKKLGIIGMGRIGIAVARRAKAFGLSIHYHNRQCVSPAIEQELDAQYWHNLDDMLTEMDIVSVHCPAKTETHHLLSSKRLLLMKPTAYIVNTARGNIIDEQALAQTIANGKLAGAGLDVFEREPAVTPLLENLANQGKVILLPHMGSATFESRVEMGEKVIINIRAFFDHHRPPDRIIPEKRR
ncbi:2-hydroxyacid dehydrogenase [Bartonella tamiae]|uniref:Glyoxylate reductase n=1 Tax=Bartonella tamiae Th239 TaxID=1094558 RepID=J0QY27_9HYPH|nr:D-glycerate dehydrogenase [Bartonella tamiae]EJF90991.1 hypothetical protein ME5_00323 [Bartonella tamiae Th239]EJF93344.1 hypothetical protein MEG_01558 [Bartonella tamiae Th307]